jgi:hypothetical protein
MRQLPGPLRSIWTAGDREISCSSMALPMISRSALGDAPVFQKTVDVQVEVVVFLDGHG